MSQQFLVNNVYILTDMCKTKLQKYTVYFESEIH